MLFLSACKSAPEKEEPSQESQVGESLKKQVEEQPTDFVNYDELSELARRITQFTGVDYLDIFL